MVYQFKAGAHLQGDPQAVGDRLETLRRTGALTPEAVVRDAAAVSSVLHPYFEWDDGAAAERYRLHQAGHLIRSVTVVVEDITPSPDVQVAAIRAFLPVEKRPGGHVYQSTSVVLGDAEMRRQVLSQAHQEFRALSRKYHDLKELSEVVEAVDRVGRLLAPSG